MEIIDIDTSKVIELGDNLSTISDNFDSYIESFEGYTTKMQKQSIWKGKTATGFRIASEKDIVQYKNYSKSISDLGKTLKAEAEALEGEIASLKEI